MSEEFKATLSWTGEQSEVEILVNTLKVDDPDSFVIESVLLDDENAELRVTVVSTSPSSLRSTVDDIMTCLLAANSTLSTIEFNET